MPDSQNPRRHATSDPENPSAQVDALEAALTTRHPHWLGFCHNDLQCGNVMLDKSPPRLVRNHRLMHPAADMSISQVVAAVSPCRSVCKRNAMCIKTRQSWVSDCKLQAPSLCH